MPPDDSSSHDHSDPEAADLARRTVDFFRREMRGAQYTVKRRAQLQCNPVQLAAARATIAQLGRRIAREIRICPSLFQDIDSGPPITSSAPPRSPPAFPPSAPVSGSAPPAKDDGIYRDGFEGIPPDDEDNEGWKTA